MNNIEKLIVKTNITGQLEDKTIAPICLAGAPGTAKSTTIGLLAKELNMNLVTCSGPILSHEALSGLPDTVDAREYRANSIDGSEPKATVWSIPEIMAATIRAAKDKPTILLIDDFHMVSPHLQSYFYGLLLERRLSNFRLSDNVALVLTMNNSDSAGFKGINSAVRNRMSILELDFNFEYWFEGFGNRLHYLVASFLKANPSNCMETETTGIEGYATARAWTSIASELAKHDIETINKYAKTIAGMQVSKDAANAFQSHVTRVAAVDFDNLVKSREILNMADKEPIDSIIYSYITKFIHTVGDGHYLLELMDNNANNESSAFIGFVIGELYIQFVNESESMSDGIRYVIDRILENPIKPEDYPNLSKSELDKYLNKPIKNVSIFQERAAEFIS